MNARGYLALVLFGIFFFVQSNVVYRDKRNESESKLIQIGDIMYTQKLLDETFGTESGKSRRGIGTNSPYRMWSNRAIPYSIDTKDARKNRMLRTAMDEWQNHTCLIFTQTNTVRYDVLNIATTENECWAFVGYFMWRSGTKMMLGERCWWHNTLLHELGHGIGLQHEHQRPDRDNYVTVNDARVKGDKRNFAKLKSQFYSYWDTEYDYFSIMHYAAPTAMNTTDPAMQNIIGNSRHLSFRDIKAINIMYNCKASSGTCKLEHSDCPGRGFVDKTCTCLCPLNGFDQFPVPCFPTSNGTMNGNPSPTST